MFHHQENTLDLQKPSRPSQIPSEIKPGAKSGLDAVQVAVSGQGWA